MRLYHPGLIQQGLKSSDLYSALKEQIDSAREEYRKTFMETSTGMVDYLYLELIRNLANDDDRLLGPNFPAPLV